MQYRSVESRVFNFSFGSARAEPIRFSWRCQQLTALTQFDVELSAELLNNAELLNAENQLAAFHSLENKQNLGHNFRAPAQTGYLRIAYPDFPANYTYPFVELGNLFLSEVVAPILSFFQRRRVLFSTARFTSSEHFVLAMPPFLAGEWVDSVSFGPPVIDFQDTDAALSSALSTYDALSEKSKERVRMLLHRYNELLNLPYVHERVEGLWRIIEAMGHSVPMTPQAQNEYNRLLPVCGVQQSRNLKRAVATLVNYGIPYGDADVKESFEIRNLSMHEYLNLRLLSYSTLPQCFSFLHRCADHAIAKELGLSAFALKDAAFWIIQNRVL